MTEAADHVLQRLPLDRFGEKIESVQLEGAERRPHAPRSGHGDHVDGRVAAFDLAEHFGAVHARHNQVQKDDVHGGILQALESLLGGKGVGDFVAVFREGPVQGVRGGPVVVHNENLKGGLGGGLGGGHGVPRCSGGPIPRAGRLVRTLYTPPSLDCQGVNSIKASFGR